MPAPDDHRLPKPSFCFEVDVEAYDRFKEMLDAPVKPDLSLQRLLSTPTVFDTEQEDTR